MFHAKLFTPSRQYTKSSVLNGWFLPDFNTNWLTLSNLLFPNFFSCFVCTSQYAIHFSLKLVIQRLLPSLFGKIYFLLAKAFLTQSFRAYILLNHFIIINRNNFYHIKLLRQTFLIIQTSVAIIMGRTVWKTFKQIVTIPNSQTILSRPCN